MSDALIASLQKQLDEKNAQIATLNAEAKDRRIKNKKLQADFDALKAENETAVKDRDAFKAAAETAPNEWKAKHDALAKSLVERDHRDAFRAVGEFKVKAKDDKGVESERTYTLNDGVQHADVWAKLGYAAEGDVPTAEAITGHYGRAREAAPYLFREKAPDGAAPGAGAPQNPQANRGARPGPGAGRGDHSPQPSVQAQVDAAHGSRNAWRIA